MNRILTNVLCISFLSTCLTTGLHALEKIDVDEKIYPLYTIQENSSLCHSKVRNSSSDAEINQALVYCFVVNIKKIPKPVYYYGSENYARWLLYEGMKPRIIKSQLTKTNTIIDNGGGDQLEQFVMGNIFVENGRLAGFKKSFKDFLDVYKDSKEVCLDLKEEFKGCDVENEPTRFCVETAEKLKECSSKVKDILIRTSTDGKVFSLSYNKDGAVLKSEDTSEKIYLGKDCDAFSKKMGKGSWAQMDDGFLITINKLKLGFSKQKIKSDGSCDF